MYLKGFILLQTPLVFFLLKYYTKEMIKSSYYILCKITVCNAGDLGLIPGLGGSPGEGKGYPLQYSGLENSMDCIVHGVAKSWTWLSDFHLRNWMNTLYKDSEKVQVFNIELAKELPIYCFFQIWKSFVLWIVCLLFFSYQDQKHIQVTQSDKNLWYVNTKRRPQ